MSTSAPGTGGTYSCPHFDKIDETTLRRLFSKVAAVRSEDRELFDFTHRPIEVYRTPLGNSEDAEIVTEAEVYGEFSENRIGNFVVIIEGEVGTGKSELCAYLSHRLTDDGRPILHVDKDDDLLSILSDRIPKFYEEHFGEKLDGTTEFQQLRADIQNNPQTVANNATSGAILNLRKLGYHIDVVDEQENAFRDFVRQKLQELIQRGEYGKEVKFLSAGAYAQNDFLHVFDQPIEDSEALSLLNEQLWREIRNRYGTSSLDDMLERVGERFEDTRPALVFEDFSIAAMEADKLRNYMERDKGTDNWDFIVAGTRDSTEILHTRTAEDRFEFYQTNVRDSKRVIFLNKESAVDFARPYLGYIKSIADDSVRYDRTSDDGQLNLLPAPEGSICAECGFCDEHFRDLFPFNAEFLHRIYTGLDDSQQSPREYVEKIFDVLEEYYHSDVKVPSSARGLSPLEDPLLIPDAIGEHSEDLARLFMWYGKVSDGQIHVDRRFSVAFGVDDPATEDELPDIISAEDGLLTVPTAGDEPGPETRTGIGADPRGDVRAGKPPVELEIEQHLRKVGPWKEYPEQNFETGNYLKRGIGDALERLTDNFALIEGTRLRYNLSSQKEPFVLTNATETPESFQVDIDPDEFRDSDLRKILRFGIRRDMEPATADYDSMLKKYGTHLVGYAIRWRRQLQETYLNADNVFYKRNARYDFADFVLASYALIVAFDTPTQVLSAEILNERFADDTDYKLDKAVDDWCEQNLDPDEYQSIVDMMGYAKYIEELLGELLGLGRESLDLRRLRKRLTKKSPYEVLSMLGRGYINNIDSRVQFTNGPKLKNVADSAYDLRQAIDEINDFGPDEDTLTTVLDELQNLDMVHVRSVVEHLEVYENVSSEAIESLKRFKSIPQGDIDEAVRLANHAKKLRGGDPNERKQLQAILMSVHLHKLDAFQRYDGVILEPADQVTGLGQKFREVAEYYVE